MHQGTKSRGVGHRQCSGRYGVLASRSMKGFAGAGESTAFSTLVEGLGDDLPGCQLYKYGQKGRRASADGEVFIQAARFGREMNDGLVAYYKEFYGNKHKPETTFGNVNADVIADKEPGFKPMNFCAVIRGSRWSS